jgi:hypothetical protein
LLRVIPHDNLPARLLDVVQALGHVSYEAFALGWEADSFVNGEHNLFTATHKPRRSSLNSSKAKGAADAWPDNHLDGVKGEITPIYPSAMNCSG